MPCLRGEQHPSRKLTTEDVIAIRISYVPGRVSMADLAGHYRVSRQTISVILQGRTWGHLLPEQPTASN